MAIKDSLRGIQGIIFELDSVLFDKSDWVIPGAEYAAQQMKLDTQRAVKLAHDYIQQHGGADPQIYNYILVGCGQFDTAMNIRAFTSLVNQFQPRSRSIQFFPGVEEALRLLRRHYKLAVVTDGPPDTQRRKIIALGLQEIINLLVYTDEIEGIKSRLPDPRPLLLATSEMRVRPQQTMFVGHNPIKHFLRTRELGFATVRVLSGEYGRQDYLSDDHRADFDLPSVARLPEILGFVTEGQQHAVPAQPAQPAAAPPAVDTGEEGRGMPFELLKQLTDPLAPRVHFNVTQQEAGLGPAQEALAPLSARPSDALHSLTEPAQALPPAGIELSDFPQTDVLQPAALYPVSENGQHSEPVEGLVIPGLAERALSAEPSEGDKPDEGKEAKKDKPVLLDFSTM